MHLSEIAQEYPAMHPVVERVQIVDHVETLYPPQAAAIKAGVLDGKNLVLSIPTASGKTLVAELALMQTALNGKKALYTAPLRALASEKYADLKEKFGGLAKIGISTGEYDSKGEDLGNFDILVVTNEKLDSLMRHKPAWLDRIGLVVLDEVHLLNDAHRGPTLEMVTTRMLSRGVQLLALSATIENAEELAAWLTAELIESDFRPIPLHRGVFLENKVEFDSQDTLKLEGNTADPIVGLALDTVKNKAQALVFVNTRRSAEKQAEETGKKIYDELDTKMKKELSKVSEKIEAVLENPTRQCKRLALCMRHGTAFHHAGLHAKQRELVEENFKNTLVKVICATPTLAAGVNLPGRRVVIRDYKRYGTMGMEPLPVLEIHQMFGRAGRPKYDPYGEAILLASTQDEFDQLWEHYIEGRPEEISSKLGVEPVLRTHVLGLISEKVQNKESLHAFFGKTFYARQYADDESLAGLIDRVLDLLYSWKFIDYDADNFKSTRLGRRVSELYLDPLTAHEFIELLHRNPTDDLVLLTHICDTAEMRPLGGVRRVEEAELYEHFDKYDLDEDQMRAFKQAYIFGQWIDERTDDQLFERYNMAPGTLRQKLNVADWLLYACGEIARVTQKDRMQPTLREVRIRLKHGVRKELLPLIRLRGIGRVRARKLHTAGFKTGEELKKADSKKLETILGVKVATSVQAQLHA